MKAFNKNIASKKIKIQMNKDTYIKRLSISLSCMFLIIVVMLFAFAKYESSSPEYTLINGRVDSATSDFNVVSYVYDGETNSQPPSKNDGYILTDLTCTNATGEWDDVNWELRVSNLTNKVKCTLTFDNQSNYQIIEYNPNGGYLAEQYIKGTIGEQIGNLPTPVKTGYTFAGWYKESGFSTLISSNTVVDSSLTTLYAKYTENSINITVNGNNVNVENYKFANVQVPQSSITGTETTLWTNPNTSALFSSQAVELSDYYTNYNRIRFYYYGYGSTANDEYYVEYTKEMIDTFGRQGSIQTGANMTNQGGITVYYNGTNYTRIIRRSSSGDNYFQINTGSALDGAGTATTIAKPIRITGIR